jgi:hypothetical protein
MRAVVPNGLVNSCREGYNVSQKGQQGATANAHRRSFFAHDSRIQILVLAPGERRRSLTFGKEDASETRLASRHRVHKVSK